jgi:hypothetical protein
VPQKICLDAEDFVEDVVDVAIAIAAGENGNPIFVIFDEASLT